MEKKTKRMKTSDAANIVISRLAEELNVPKKKARELFNQAITADWVMS